MYTRKEKEIAIELYLKNNKKCNKDGMGIMISFCATLIEWYRKQAKKNYPKKKKKKGFVEFIRKKKFKEQLTII